MLPPMLMAVVTKIADRFGVEPALLAAIVEAESSGRAWRTRFEPHTDRYLIDVARHAKRCGITADTETVHQKTSWGLVQVMGFTARDHGFEGNLPELCLPETGLAVGCRHLKDLQRRFGKPDTLGFDEAVVAAYNAGSPRKMRDGRLWVNEGYVRKIADFYRAALAG